MYTMMRELRLYIESIWEKFDRVLTRSCWPTVCIRIYITEYKPGRDSNTWYVIYCPISFTSLLVIFLIFVSLNTLGPRQICCGFTYDILKFIFLYEISGKLITFHWNLIRLVRLTMCHYRFRQWFGIDQATNRYLNQWWFRLLSHICVKQPRWIKYLIQI